MQVRLSLYYLRSVFRKRFAGLFGRHEIIVMLVIYVVGATPCALCFRHKGTKKISYFDKKY